jgi:hypothetical protein
MSNQKLSLNRETLRALSDRESREVAGGKISGALISCQNCASNNGCTWWPGCDESELTSAC